MKTWRLLVIGVVIAWGATGVDWNRKAAGAEVEPPKPIVDVVSGGMVVLDELDSVNAKLGKSIKHQVNVGGLIVIRIDDTDGEPTKYDNLAIKPEGAWKRIGQLKSAQDESGAVTMSGNGFTWLMYTPVRSGKATISLRCFPNDKAKPVERVHHVNVGE